MYWRPIALALKKAGFFDSTIRKLKSGRADALKIANYALTFAWM